MADSGGERLPEFSRALQAAGCVPRAVRLAFRAPVAYRAAYGDRWSDGELIDISRTGALFAPADPSLPEPDLRLVIFLSHAALQAGGFNVPVPDLCCGGRVARVATMADGRRGVAIRFDRDWQARPLEGAHRGTEAGHISGDAPALTPRRACNP
jgi:hypothetical protein